MHTRMKISGFIRGFIIGALGALALVAHGVIPHASQEAPSILDDPAVIVVQADFSSRVGNPARLTDGASIPIEVRFE